MTPACCLCMGQSLADQQGAQRLALCPEHLAERLREMRRPLPSSGQSAPHREIA